MNPQDARLQALCEEYGLSEQVQEGLYLQADYLHGWRNVIWPSLLTTKQRLTALSKVSKLAMELAIYVDGLPFDLKDMLRREYFSGALGRAEFEVRLKHATFTTDPDGALLTVEAGVVANVAKAADRVREKLAQTSTTGTGRPVILYEQSRFIERVAEILKPAKIKPSNGGRFRPLCEAVFEAAGVTFPERALRYFLSEVRPHMREAGLCL